MTTHELKTWPHPYEAIACGSKTYEFRKNDRGFEERDIVVLREWDPETRTYTGRSSTAEVGFVLAAPAFGVPDGHCIFSLLHVSGQP